MAVLIEIWGETFLYAKFQHETLKKQVHVHAIGYYWITAYHCTLYHCITLITLWPNLSLWNTIIISDTRCNLCVYGFCCCRVFLGFFFLFFFWLFVFVFGVFFFYRNTILRHSITFKIIGIKSNQIEMQIFL